MTIMKKILKTTATTETRKFHLSSTVFWYFCYSYYFIFFTITTTQGFVLVVDGFAPPVSSSLRTRTRSTTGLLLRMVLQEPPPSSSTPFHISKFSTSATAKQFSNEEYLLIGQGISESTTIQESLELASKFWLPDDDNLLPNHYKTQLIHHQKRQRWASQLLEKIAQLCLSISSTTTTTIADKMLLDDERFIRLILASSIPFHHHHGDDDEKNIIINKDQLSKEGNWIETSLISIYTIVAASFTSSSSSSSSSSVISSSSNTAAANFVVETSSSSSRIDNIQNNNNRQSLLYGIQLLIERATMTFGDQYPLNQACQICWSIQGLKYYLPDLQLLDDIETGNNENNLLSSSILEERVNELPFTIIPQGIDWSQIIIDKNSFDAKTMPPTPTPLPISPNIIDQLLDEIPFQKDILVTRNGNKVQERRGTAWMAKPNIGALAYSGKFMEPQSLQNGSILDLVMRTVEQRLGLVTTTLNDDDDDDENFSGNFFDCALCNHYADGQSACKYHTDPEHGSYWDRTTVVVAAGSCRKFAFKPIDTTWNEWDTTTNNNVVEETSNSNNNNAAILPLFAGDLVVMTENCNDDFYHAVHSSIGNNDPRISLVLKRALGRGSGQQKGHGLYGQGKRRRKQRNGQQQQHVYENSKNSSSNNNGKRRQHASSTTTTTKKVVQPRKKKKKKLQSSNDKTSRTLITKPAKKNSKQSETNSSSTKRKTRNTKRR